MDISNLYLLGMIKSHGYGRGRRAFLFLGWKGYPHELPLVFGISNVNASAMETEMTLPFPHEFYNSVRVKSE